MSLATTRRDRFRRIVHRYRSKPGEYGLRPYSISVITREYGGGEIGQGAVDIEETAIVERGGYPPKCRNMTSEELALAGYDKQTWEIGPITPEFSVGGTPLSVLTQSSIGTDTEPHFVLTGPEFPEGANFRAVRVQTDKALHFTIQVQRVADSG